MTSRPFARFRPLIAGALGLVAATLAVPSSADSTHKVRKGESLWAIARKHRVSIQALKELNHIKGDTVFYGQRLKLPSAATPAPAAEESTKERAPRATSKEPSPPPAEAWFEPPSSLRFEPEANPDWVLKRPSADDQRSPDPAARGGNPCMSEDPGFGNYHHWSRAVAMGHMLLPKTRTVNSEAEFDVMFHFHGHEAVRKEWVRVMKNTVLVAIDQGIGSGSYRDAFQDPTLLQRLIQSVERAVAKKDGIASATARNVGLSAWSAGYGAVGQLLSQSYAKRRVDAVILLDGLHTGYWGPNLNALRLSPFVDYARRAAKGDAFFFVSHSAIAPPGYASTTETANFLIWKVGGEPVSANPRPGDPFGMQLNSHYSRGNFHVRGFKGSSTEDHCAQIGLLRDVLRVHIKRRWRAD